MSKLLSKSGDVVALLLSEKDETLKGKKFKSAVSIGIGEFDTAGMSINLDYRAATEARKELDIKDTNILSLSFIVKEGIDPFSLGELSGSIKNILSLGAMFSKIRYQLKSKMGKDEAGNVIYTISMMSSDTALAAVKQIVDSNAPEYLKGRIATSEGPLAADKKTLSEGFIKAKVGLEWSVNRKLLDIFESFAANDVELSETDSVIMNIVKSLKNMEIDLKFEDLQQFWDKFLKATMEGTEEIESYPFKIANWASLQPALTIALRSALGDKSIPAPVFDLYEKLAYLTGLHGIRLCAGDHLFEVTCHNFSVFALLPSLSAIRAADN
eukprot:TRINITY_DN4347_c0_g1_i3.p1 TRINITY_DN4347_c0_g1~~TRINITY_DN4347_c0_g1_i3.p1  ORF type:complete len:326 (-),score=44.48 TRINITY_DN4347_c0_g1_i3:237-1214(-)